MHILRFLFPLSTTSGCARQGELLHSIRFSFSSLFFSAFMSAWSDVENFLVFIAIGLQFQVRLRNKSGYGTRAVGIIVEM